MSGQVQTNTMSFGQVSVFQMCLPLHASRFSQLSYAREQGLWRAGRGASPDLGAAGRRFTTHVLSHGRGAWATKVSVQPRCTGLCCRSPLQWRDVPLLAVCHFHQCWLQAVPGPGWPRSLPPGRAAAAG